MSFVSRLALSLATVLAPAVATAADYDPPIFVDDSAEYVPVEVGSGWYLRGDIGYIGQIGMGTVDYRTFDAGTSTYSTSSFATQLIDRNVTFGGGFGYAFTDWLRADATLDGYRTGFSGTTTSTLPCDPLLVGTTCRSEDESSVGVLSIMANGYVDLGTFVGFTPYAGAGVGYSLVSWGDLSNQTYCVPGANPCPDPNLATTTTHEGADSWRFTYALMAGMAYDISDNMKIDVGYKYRRVSGGDMFQWDAGSALAGATGVQGTHGSIDTHEVRVGLRYELW